jgi:dTDP-4-amino-4,6-dideoxygalactose transaminase
VNIPFVDLQAQYRSIKDEIDQAIANVLRDTAFVGGRYVDSFEGHFAAYIGGGNCIGVANGTDALFIALKALGIGPGDEVITVANSFIATSEAITAAGARVVFVDCDSRTYTIDIAGTERAITKKTRAIIPVHLYGQMADMAALKDLADKHGLRIIEDAAQAHGARFRDRTAGTWGDCACFSFYPGKNLGAYGDGGAVVTGSSDLAKKIRMFANHGRIEKYDHELEGINSRLDGIQAAILDVKLKHLERWTDRRRTVAARYDSGLKDIVVTPAVAPDRRHVYHLYVVRVKHREKVVAFLKERGIATGIHYPIPLPFLNAYRYLGHTASDFPVVHALQHEILSLPMYGDLTDAQVDYVIENLREAVGRS